MRAHEIDDNQSPFNRVVYIEVRYDTGAVFTGSGALVGRNDILTASHVIADNYIDENGQYIVSGVQDIIVRPSFDPDEEPGSDNIVIAHSWHTYGDDQFDPDKDGMIFSGDGRSNSYSGAEMDIALITLDVPLGDEYGYFGATTGFTSGFLDKVGHPGDKNHNPIYERNFATKDPIDNFIDISKFTIASGDSGGPLYIASSNQIVGVVSTSLAAPLVDAHWDWLAQVSSENDQFIQVPDAHITKIENGVYRFFNNATGSHFYTYDYNEAANIAKHNDVYQYEGVSYRAVLETSPYSNALFRFFNKETGTHFYTASQAERDMVMSTLPSFNYEGVGYHINAQNDGDDLSLHRFFNTETGTHFYTASDAERDGILNTLPNFNYEGVVGYVDVA